MNVTTLFKALNAPLSNSRTSWGAVRPDGVVVLRVWQHEPLRVDQLNYLRVLRRTPEEQAANPTGYPERISHLDLVAKGAPCYLVVCIAKNINAEQLEIRECIDDAVFVGGHVLERDNDVWIEKGKRVALAEARAYRS